MYRKIMIPTDGSGFDRKAILIALRMAERCGAKVCLVRVLTTGAFLGMEGSADERVSAGALRVEHHAALRELHALAAECRNISNADISVDLEQGPAAEALERYAGQNDIDLIVISSHGRRGVARLSLGSVTDSLIRGTTIPVLVVKPSASYLTPEASKEFHHIIVPLDGSALAEQILTRVVPLAKLEDAGITLLHVLAPSDDLYEEGDSRRLPWWEKRVAGAKAYLSHRASEVRLKGVAATIEVVAGEKVAEAITDYSRRVGADLIAIATHGRGGFARVLRGSVADAVTKSTMSSILVFHPDKLLENSRSSESVEESREDVNSFA